jgi:hypothetical protein
LLLLLRRLLLLVCCCAAIDWCDYGEMEYICLALYTANYTVYVMNEHDISYSTVCDIRS